MTLASFEVRPPHHPNGAANPIGWFFFGIITGITSSKVPLEATATACENDIHVPIR
jgi:hypothetical protein